MKNIFAILLIILLPCLGAVGQPEKPLRVFIRAGAKTHGPGQHDHPRFLKEWKDLLTQRGAQAEGTIGFPTTEQLAATDVLILISADAGDIAPDQRASLDQFLKRGGGLVVIHDGVCGHDPQWFKTIVGGAWEHNHSGYFEGDVSIYYQDHTHPITRGASNFDFEDEIYYDLHLMPEAHILAATYKPDARNKHEGRMFPSIYEIVPQMWTYEKDDYRAFVCIPGHNYKTFNLPHFRSVLLRGIAWAGKRDADLLTSKEELAALSYPEGGPTAPAKAAEKITVPPDFTINLVASEPLIEKPISMDWDPKGRLWIAETPEYPYRQDRSRPPRDRISILEDVNGDGCMDRKSVFYEGLDLVTSMVFYRDGVIVSQAPDIYWLRDTKGTGHADTKEVLYTGFGTRDTHAVISNLRWGMDGWIYATLGYSKGEVYSGDGKKHFGQLSEGVIRFRPDGSAIEQFSSKGGNTWGVDIAPDGEVFFSQANGNHIDHVVMPEAALARGRVGKTTSFNNIEDHNRSFPFMGWTKQAYVQIDWVGNFTAASGSCIYDGGAWPAKYDYTCYVAEPTINIVHQDILTPKGASYVASKDPDFREKEFITSSDLWFRPIHQRVGPDGALYVLDFYNQAVVHNDTRGVKGDPKSNAAVRPDRDHSFGRIWRVQHKEARKLPLPKLDSATSAELAKALEHPNMWVRQTAERLLVEGNRTDGAPALEALLKSDQAPGFARVHALWTLNNLGLMSKPTERELLVAAINSSDSAVGKNALKIAATAVSLAGGSQAQLQRAVLDHVNDPNSRIQLEALIALGNLGVNPMVIRTLVGVYPKLKDQWLESAAMGVATKAPLEVIEAALNSGQGADFAGLVGRLSSQVGEQGDVTLAARMVVSVAAKPASGDALKAIALENLTRGLRQDASLPWTPELQKAFKSLLASTNPILSTATLPLLARWDRSGKMTGEIKSLVQQLTSRLGDQNQPDEQRAQLVTSLLAVRQMNPEILTLVARIPGSGSSPALERRVIAALGNLTEPAVGVSLVEAYPKLVFELQDFTLNELFKRSDWSLALLDAIAAGKINLASLGPVAINRLRTHGDKAVAQRANQIVDTLLGPETKEKNALIAKFTPLVVQPGDAAKGKQLFTQNCAICHKFNGEGKDIAPDLTGMGAHGPAELIIHVLDPNREVEPNYQAYSIETGDGETYNGVIARENKASVMLRNSSGDMEIKVKAIKSRRNTGLSLMPNGFEALGGEALRDILTYLCAGESRFRILDLRPAFTANSSKGLWNSPDNVEEALPFKKFGLIKVDDVPFEVVNPLKSSSGNNLIVLKGGLAFAKTFPQSVEVKNIGIKATRLHFLGGVGGWAYPCCGEDKRENLPVAKVTIFYADNQTEEIILKNAQEFADYNGNFDVPGSKSAPDLLTHGQIRWFTKSLKHQETMESIRIESFDNGVAPAFVAITADTDAAGATAAPAAPRRAAAIEWGPGIHVLSVGGGTSHDFNRWFNQIDSATLSANGGVSFHYTEKFEEILPTIKDLDVLYLSSNQPLNDPLLRKGIFDFADAGHGLLLFHPALWNNWKDWPEYPRVLVGGAAGSHDKYGEFEVTLTDVTHPLLAGVPKTFRLKDELYHFEVDPKAAPMRVLAEGRNLATGKTYPVLWIVEHPKARIVCCTLGHDGASHELDAFKTILQNSVRWAGGK
jgi:putative membrane-bound dehydrogenase-like protein